MTLVAQWRTLQAAAAGQRAYATEVFDELGLDPEKLPRVHAATDVVGKLTGPAASAMGLTAGIPVVAGGGDGACATVGAGAVRPGDTYCCIGTTAWIASTCRESVIDDGQRVFDILSLDGQTCGLFGTIQSAGRSLDWVLELLGEPGFKRFEELLGSAPAGSGGLVFLPYLEGERSPVFDPQARGVFFGITPGHGREHFLRAVTEGVSFALRSVLDVMRESGTVATMRLIGGGAQSAAWQQMLADVCDVEMQLLSTRAADATSLGAAIAAGVGVGLFPSMAQGVQSIAVTEHRTPQAARTAVCEPLYNLFRSLYPRLRPAYAELQRCLAGAAGPQET
ncbi:MAG: FGGY-family carbohydrate kinase [Planctomycetota bacterium]